MNPQDLERWLEANGGGAELPEREARRSLEAAVDHLLQTDFSRLVSILYRIDVSESKLRAALAGHPDTPASVLISDLILARLDEKRRSREQHRRPDPGIPEDERW